MTTKGLENVLTMDRVEFGEAWINAIGTRFPDFLVAVRDAAVQAATEKCRERIEKLETEHGKVYARGYEAGKASTPLPTLDESLVARQDEVKREAAREALTRCAEMGDGYTTARVWFGDTSGGMASVSVGVIVREFRDREYPAPQEAWSVTLACGDEVEVGPDGETLTRYAPLNLNQTSGPRARAYVSHAAPEQWRTLLVDTDTLADLRAVERLAKENTQ